MLLRPSLLVVLLLAACHSGGKQELAGKEDATQALLLSPEDLRSVGRAGAQAQGPVIAGSIQPERRADLRAEVSAVVLQVFRENGDEVRKGDLLMRLDDTAIRDSLASAEESAHAVGQAFEQAERHVQRLRTLQSQGMTSMQALEDAEVRRNNARSDLATARSRVVVARQQLQRTGVRAPFDGIVSERKASAGDTAQIGKELVKVIDPSSMRFEGLVSADSMHEIQAGQAVDFRVNGHPQASFTGRVKRINASANAFTRQVEVLVSFADPAAAPRVAGLYAEGRVDTGEKRALSLPEASIVREQNAAYVWRVKDEALAKTPVQLGERDSRSGEYPVNGDLAEGDQVVRNPNGSLQDGQRVEFHASTAGTTASVEKAR